MADGPWAQHLPAGAVFDPADLVAGGSLPRVWAERWAAHPAEPALCFGGDWWTAGDLDRATAAAARRLAALGLRAGDRMVWSTTTSAGAVVACLAALRLGAVVVPANAAYTRRELAHIVADVRPAVAVVDRPEQADWVAAAGTAEPVATVFPSDLAGPPDLAGPGPDGADVAVADLDGPGRSPATGGGGAAPVLDRPGLDRSDPDDPALIVFTSGTTGAPKGAVLSHANLLAGVRSVALAWRWTAADRLVLGLPLFHVHGLCIGLFGTLAVGGSAVVLDRFSADGVLDAAAGQGGTLFFGVPTMYHRLADGGRVKELAGLRLCVSGSAPLPASLWGRIHADAGVAVVERYGMTETLLTVSNPYDGDRRPGTVGLPLPGVDVRVDADGALWVRGPSVFDGYWERPDATAGAFDGGWFRTGDVVEVDADGYLAVRGRQSDLIISGGYNVYPAEVEDVLLAHPAVAEVAVAGVPSEEWGESVEAWVVPADHSAPGTLPDVPMAPLPEALMAPLPEALMAYAADHLAPYKRPRRVHLVAALPRNAMGKVQRGALGRG
ncbi:MAG TPA: AMP-binding protein [Acidimicrobiales bacterium]|nr:AMP-binding protein [Acidimicrobiales bacterium]